MTRFEAWLKIAEPGDQYAYCQGKGLAECPATWAARLAYVDGEVLLVQRRISHAAHKHDVGRFAWVAIKRRNIIPQQLPRGCGWKLGEDEVRRAA